MVDEHLIYEKKMASFRRKEFLYFGILEPVPILKTVPDKKRQ
jgi:hypothetical protein